MYQKMSLAFALLFGGMFSLNAQIEQGTMVIGPEFGFVSQTIDIEDTDEEIKSTTLDLTLAGGYFVAKNVLIGLQFNASSSKAEVDSDESTNTSTFIGAIAGYMVPLSDRLYLPIGIGVGLVNNKDDNGTEVKTSGLGYGISAGLEYFLNDNVGLKLSLGWNSSSLEEEDEAFELSVSELDSRLGFNIYF